MKRYLDYVGPWLWLAIAVAFAVKGEAWLAMLTGIMAGVRLIRVARLLGRHLGERRTRTWVDGQHPSRRRL